MDAQDHLTKLPSIDLLLQQEKTMDWKRHYSLSIIKGALREAQQAIRRQLQKKPPAKITRQQLMEDILQLAEMRLMDLLEPRIRPVINATGIILHTGLGRAPLSEAAQKNVQTVMQGYCNLEIDLDSGKRGERNNHVVPLLCQLCRAEHAVVVNNNAAAVLLVLNSLCAGKEAIISRGQLIEIGGAFRLPEVMEKSGAIMREVGTTNKTKLQDYRKAINENTGGILVAHSSNYRILGFTEEVELAQVAELAHSRKLPLIHDLGGGVLIDLRRFNLPYEPMVQDSLKAGVDVVTFSGDKVMGGPQSGLIVGKKRYIDAIYRNPLLRAFRCDKLTYAALEATLRLYLNEDTLLREHCSLAMFNADTQSLRTRAEKLVAALKPSLQHH
ncbi:L-seryl-tRNA(Sec) selenium transferase, partial [candidate division KSB1 bacterium]|nr:L-seryl-tRNA(Sec) selenium transferase [candidate division KSB1 bacterium]